MRWGPVLLEPEDAGALRCGDGGEVGRGGVVDEKEDDDDGDDDDDDVAGGDGEMPDEGAAFLAYVTTAGFACKEEGSWWARGRV